MNSVICNEKNLILDNGTSLCSKIWMQERGGPWPALVMRQPYSREIASTITYAHPKWWANHGYLVIVQDVRGQGGSDDAFNGFEQEYFDTSRTHSWVRSLPECNGLIGTYGFSYQGITQLLCEPKSLPPTCLAPSMTGLKENEHWSCDGGAFWWDIGISWGLQLAAQKLKRSKELKGWEEIRESLENKSYLRTGTYLLEKYDPEGMAMKWLKNSNESNIKWTEHKPLKEWLKKPMLLIGGWWDPHLKGVLDIYEQSVAAGGNPELHIGPASHLQWWGNIQRIHLDFFDRHLKQQQPQKSKQNVQIWNITNKTWHSLENRDKSSIYWGLKSGGLACIDTSEGILESNNSGDGDVVLVHDPWRPAPSKGGHLGPGQGEVNRKDIDKRSDVATFTTEPLTQTISIDGKPNLVLSAKSDQEGFDLFVALSIIDPNSETVCQISTGVIRTRGVNSTKILRREINLQPLSATISKGCRLRVSIAGAAWPAIAINPGTTDLPCGPPCPNCLVTTIYLELKGSKLQIFPLVSK